MILLRLFWSFLKIGCTSFGGLSMIPVISHEMLSNHWLNVNEIADIVAIAEMTPGPLGLNCATYAGMKTAGIAGAVVANLGVLIPTFSLGVIVAICFERFKKNQIMKHIMVGIRPACLGVLIGVMVLLCKSNYGPLNMMSKLYFGILSGVDLLLLLKYKISIPLTIIISAMVGILSGFLL